ncbi:aspartate 4-decarboxylase [Agrilactobacillus yilanensis]|uniref:Aminotransferase n=1 Tax=Agrilactobacillus yilanensis TaxID=2485997 RepID=A0ABW4J5H9_9LACO|nr:aspartate 4-decarboxylase [Agrilactobacillus yilanensis]
MTESSFEALSPFELVLYLERIVTQQPGIPVLNAGRGNPNWTAPTPREAFFLLGQFSVQETLYAGGTLTGTQLKPLHDRTVRFLAFLEAHPCRGAQCLRWLLTDPASPLGMSADQWLNEACDAIIGDNYPNPVRCLTLSEAPLKAYLTQFLFNQQAVAMDVFPVEGGTAGICYLFETLLQTQLLQTGDRIALFLPTFAPYLEIPDLPQYDFEIVKIQAKQIIQNDQTSYLYPETEIDKLKDPTIKAAFIVNPSNPTANAMSAENIAQIQKLVQTKRPTLMLLTDDVYGTFVPKFQSLFSALPKNTICLYSFSKYFGATGWRVGVIAVAQTNIFDQLIQALPTSSANYVAKRYASIATTSDTIRFIDRLVADSRSIVLNHAAGLSTVQQVMIALFALYGMMDEGQAYQDEVMAICHEREQQLFAVLGLSQPLSSRDTAYYCDIDLHAWAKKRYGANFANYLQQQWTITEFLILLAQKKSLLLLKTSPFGSDTWCVRVSLANLATDQYPEIGYRLIALMDGLYQQWTLKRK